MTIIRRNEIPAPSRKRHVATLKREVLERPDDQASEPIDEYTGASDKDTWQSIGPRSRKILINLGKSVAGMEHVFEGSVYPRQADARVWFELFFDSPSGDGDRAELRTLMGKTWDLAQKVTTNDIDDVGTFAAAQATALLVRSTKVIKQNEVEDQ